MNGLALTIVIGQLPKLFGFSVDADALIPELVGFVEGVSGGQTVPAALAIGSAGLVTILVLQLWLPKIPAVLVAAVLSIIGAALLDLAARGVKLVGVLPQGFPPFTIPDVSFSDMSLLIAGAVGIAVVAVTDTISTASAFAARSGQEVRANQEMIGIGAANVAAGLFQGFPVSTSGSRTAVAEQSGSKTQLTGLVGAALIAVMLLFLPRLLQDLPQPTLAAVLIAAAISLADITGTARLWHQRRTEFEISLAAFLGVALLGVLPGIGVAVILSILNVFRRAWWPYQTKLGLVDGVRGYHDVTSYPHAQHLGSGAGQPGDHRGLEHLPARARITPDDRDGTRGPVAVGEDTGSGTRHREGQFRREVGVRPTPDAVGPEEASQRGAGQRLEY